MRILASVFVTLLLSCIAIGIGLAIDIHTHKGSGAFIAGLIIFTLYYTRHRKVRV